jgi:hypothetical protein
MVVKIPLPNRDTGGFADLVDSFGYGGFETVNQCAN